MLRHEFPDLRELWRNDLRFSRQFSMRAPLSWLREYVRVDATAHEIARRLAVSSLEVDRVIDVGVADVGDNLVAPPRRQGRRRRQAPERRQAPALPGRRGGGRAAADRLRRLELRRRATVAVGLPGVLLPGFPAPLDERPLRGELSRGMILAEDEIGLGTDHAGIMLLPDGIEPGTPLADVLPVHDQVLDVTPTMNRVDLLSMVGLAREVATLFDGELMPVDVDDPPILHPEWVEIMVDDPGGCPRYIARVFTNVAVGPSPMWLRARLHAAGMRSISNVVDITNYVMHVYGSPLHAFDRAQARTAAGSSSAARGPARRCGRSTARVRTLDERDLLITDGERPVALAAIMGGLDSEVTDETTEVLLEAANFEPIGVLRTSERLGLRTEGSNRWEKGVDPYLAEPAAVLASRLHRRPRGRRADRQRRRPFRPAGAARRPAAARAHRPGRRARGRRRPSSARSSSGSASRSSDDWDVTVPTWRARDVTREIDLVEEVARVVLDRVPHDDAAAALGRRAPDARPAAAPARRGRARRRRLQRGVHVEPRRRPTPTRTRSGCRIR